MFERGKRSERTKTRGRSDGGAPLKTKTPRKSRERADVPEVVLPDVAATVTPSACDEPRVLIGENRAQRDSRDHRRERQRHRPETQKYLKDIALAEKVYGIFMSFNSVDLPLPDLPSIKTMPVSGNVNDTSSSALVTTPFLVLYRNTYVGFVFQEYNILDEFTVEENIALACDITSTSLVCDRCLSVSKTC